MLAVAKEMFQVSGEFPGSSTIPVKRKVPFSTGSTRMGFSQEEKD